jgi:branched-chain amino acid transport system permease protein
LAGHRGVLAIGLVLTFALTERYHHRILTLVFLWAAMGLAWNIISGYAGQISFGHQAFFGIGAYTTVLLAAKLKLTPWLGMGWGRGGGARRGADRHAHLPLAGIYFGLATLAYPLIFRIVMDYLGFQEVAIPMVREHPILFMQFEEPRSFDLLALALLGATLVLSRLIEGSRLGYSLRAIKENEQAALAMGVDALPLQDGGVRAERGACRARRRHLRARDPLRGHAGGGVWRPGDRADAGCLSRWAAWAPCGAR